MVGGGYSPLRNEGSHPLVNDQGIEPHTHHSSTSNNINNTTTSNNDIDNGDADWCANFDVNDTSRNRPTDDNNHHVDQDARLWPGNGSTTPNTRLEFDGNRPLTPDGDVRTPTQQATSPHHPLSSTSTSSPSSLTSPRASYRSHPASPSRTNAKYTALRPTSVQALPVDGEYPYPAFPESSDTDDVDIYDSQVSLDLGSPSLYKQQRRFRYNVALCALLTAAASTLVFGLLYVFVILPAHKGDILGPDGRPPSADLVQLKHLGPNVVMTSCGMVRGTYENGAHVFRGIPYARPPTDSLRWREPVELSYDTGTCWQDVRNATSFANVCTQSLVTKESDNEKSKSGVDSISKSQLVGSEDCLYLNVWTPNLSPSDNLPVLVWIHSGDFVYGSGNARGMSPNSELATATKAVYVSFNFRLGVFGFLALDALREESRLPGGATGNYGIMDQQMALRWVKDNIRHFGGDPMRVTVFGHGSGATSIQALLLSPDSTGLFKAAWLSSPVALLNKTLDEACKDNQRLMDNSGCSDAACLRDLDASTLVTFSPWTLDRHWTLDQLIGSPGQTQLRNDVAIFDGHTVHHDAVEHGPAGPTVPVVIGTTYSDLSGLQTDLPVNNMTWDDLDTMLEHQFSAFGTEVVDQLKSLYSQNPKDGYSVYSSPTPAANNELFPLPSRQFAKVVRDVQAVCPAKLLADKMAALYATSAPVYLYVAEAVPSHELRLQESSPPEAPSSSSSSLSSSQSSSGGSEAHHTDALFVGWDMVSFFGTYHDFGFRMRQSDLSFQDIVRQEVLSLARSGKPNASRWHTEDITTGIFRSAVTVYEAEATYFDGCHLLSQLGFFRYTWSGQG